MKLVDKIKLCQRDAAGDERKRLALSKKSMNTKIILTLIAIAFSSIASAQTNVFPSTGKVGIGTEDPLENLSIYGGGGQDSRSFGIGPAQVRRWVFTASGYDQSLSLGNYPLIIEHEAANFTGDFVIRQSGGDFVVKHWGNVGIGTTTPTHKLAVNGTVRAKEVIVDTGWSDFVFEDSYSLRTLDEVELHIEKHGHLPDVPSASSVQSEGLSVGETQKIMMQKIEELTLYVIEQDKKIKKLESKLSQLNGRYNSDLSLRD